MALGFDAHFWISSLTKDQPRFPAPSVDVDSLARAVEQLPTSVIESGLENPVALAQLMRDFLGSLSQPAFVAEYSDRFTVFTALLDERIANGRGISLHELLSMSPHTSVRAFTGFGQMPAEPNLLFPADHGLHMGYQNEWYFLTGTGVVNSSAGPVDFGVEVTVSFVAASELRVVVS
jgi:hypothetical protein